MNRGIRGKRVSVLLGVDLRGSFAIFGCRHSHWQAEPACRRERRRMRERRYRASRHQQSPPRWPYLTCRRSCRPHRTDPVIRAASVYRELQAPSPLCLDMPTRDQGRSSSTETVPAYARSSFLARPKRLAWSRSIRGQVRASSIFGLSPYPCSSEARRVRRVVGESFEDSSELSP